LNIIFGSRHGKENLSLEFSGGFFVNFLESRIAVTFSSEKEEAILRLLEYCLNMFLVEIENSWNLKWLNESKKGFRSSFSIVNDNFLLELSEEDKGWLCGSKFGSAGGIKSVNERNFIIFHGKFGMSISVKLIIEVGSEESNDEFISGGLFFKSITGEFLGWWSSFLLDPRYNCFSSSSSTVVGSFSITKIKIS
jgi:hypothetical protein